MTLNPNACAAVALMILAAVPASPPWASEGADDKVRILVTVTGARNDDGQFIVSLFRDGAGFPNDGEQALFTKRLAIEEGKGYCEFADITAGEYAIALIHDEDANGKLRTNFLGIPKEGIGTSNNPRPRFGPPKWKDAKFIAKSATVELEIGVLYL